MEQNEDLKAAQNIQKTEETSLNRWLYGADNLGKLETGTVYENQLFGSSASINNNDLGDFIIRKRRGKKGSNSN